MTTNFPMISKKRVFAFNEKSWRFVNYLTKNQNHPEMVQVYHSKFEIGFREVYDNIPLWKYFQYFAWITMIKKPERTIIYQNILNKFYFQ